MADEKRAERLCALQRRFAEGAQLTISQMANDYGVERRTVNRDLTALRDMGLDLVAERLPDGRKVWSIRVPKRKMIVPFNLTDLTSLIMGKRLFDFLRGTLLEESLDKVYCSIENAIDKRRDLLASKDLERKVYLVSEGPKRLTERHVDVLDEVLTALLEDRRLEVDYRTSGGELHRHLLEPLSLVAFRRGLYLAARRFDDGAIRTYALERFESARWRRGDRFEYPADWDPERHFSSALFIYPGDPEPVEIEFAAGSERFIGIRQFHPTQRKRVLDDGRVRLGLEVPIGDELVYWLLSFGRHVRVIFPETLRRRLRYELSVALDAYAG
ncbi:MAG: WYL domain-containing transcriptional regulator [Polyangia bacterium]